MHNTKGSTTAFATFSPYKTGTDGFWSAVTLLLGETHTPGARQPKFLHSAQFCPVSAKQLKRAGISGSRLKHGGLLFMSSFNGSAEDYFRGFSEQLFMVMDEVWSWCVDWEGAKILKNLNRFIRRYDRRSGSFFNAYPATSEGVRAALVMRRELDELHALAVSGDDEAFATAFMQLSQRLWGNGR